MVRLCFLLTAPVLAARVQVQQQLSAKVFAHLSEEDSSLAVEALEVLEELKKDSNNVELQSKYREIIGNVDWEEDRAFLAQGLSSAEPAVMLGQPSRPGTTLSLIELLRGRAARMFSTSLGRLFMGRRDFAIEEEGGETKYMIDGITASLHSRMQVTLAEEAQPRFVVRRAFNYLNPIASTIGQYIYRVIRCQPNSEGGWAGGCIEGEMLYTITKDRLGRGAFWGQDEYRVYTGTGGCRRFGHGVLSCSQDLQIMYSLSAGLSSGTHDTSFYAGNIRAIDGDFESGRLGSGEELDQGALESMKVATVSKIEGSPRALNWPIPAASIVGNHFVNEAVDTFGVLAETISDSQIAVFLEHNAETGTEVLNAIQDLATPEQVNLFASAAESFSLATDAFGFMYFYAMGLHLAKSLIWADSYHVTFTGNPTDELLVNLVAAVQDLTREQVALAPAR
jgi:hypothetical protein